MEGDDVDKSNSEKVSDMLLADFGTTNIQQDYEILDFGVKKSNSKKDLVMEGDDVEKSNLEEVSDIIRDDVVKSFNEIGCDVLGNEEMDIQNSDILKAQPRMRVKSLSLRTPGTILDRKKKCRRIE
ncbi:hypothetical protein LR48_Vigan03g138400 [Vigna angularis]|nr:hypothetical protein LR48_Vigan03g138400 [Vigna angularis]